MLGTITKKEIQNNILSFRFLFTFILLVMIVAFTVFILTNDYVKKVEEYSRRQIEIENYMKKYAHFNRINPILRPSQPPIAFYSLIRGLSADNNIEEFDNDALPAMFPLIDLTFIVTIILSLISLLFSYDSISGEKEDGTLKLMLSNNVPRSKIILGKIIGGILTLLISFLFSLIIGLLIINFNSRVLWTGIDWLALCLIVLGSFLYVTVFYCIGIFISSLHHSSSSSIMTSLFVWVLLVLIIPNLSPYIASFIIKTPSRIEVEREVSRLTGIERDKLGRKLSQEKEYEIYRKYPFLEAGHTQTEIQRLISENPIYKKAYQELKREIQKAWDKANQIQEEKADAIERELIRKEESQTRLSVIISMISPLSDFTYLATDLSSTGLRNMNYFSQIVIKWEENFDDYRTKKIAALEKENSTADWWNIPVEMSDRPIFQYKQESLINRLKASFHYYAVLILFNLIFFTAAYFSFIKYDAR
jgi:ABC-type transport system involved in multi-copper enzyme maturation permease subunit